MQECSWKDRRQKNGRGGWRCQCLHWPWSLRSLTYECVKPSRSPGGSHRALCRSPRCRQRQLTARSRQGHGDPGGSGHSGGRQRHRNLANQTGDDRQADARRHATVFRPRRSVWSDVWTAHAAATTSNRAWHGQRRRDLARRIHRHQQPRDRRSRRHPRDHQQSPRAESEADWRPIP